MFALGGAEITPHKTTYQDWARTVLELFDESAGSNISVKPCANVCVVGPPTTENRDANHHRDLDDADLKIFENRKPSLLI